jgi:hypothetical protein
MFPRLDKEADNSFFAERLGGFQPMQALNEHETSAVRPYQDRRLQTLVEHARGDFVYAPLIKGGAPFDWHVDVCDRNGLALHRAGFTSSTDGTFLGSSLFSLALHGGPSRLACKNAFRSDKRAVQSAE